MSDRLSKYMASRSIPQELIERMKQEKVDEQTIMLMGESELSKFITRIGDRIAVKHFCRTVVAQSQSAAEKDDEETREDGKKGELLKKLRMKLQTRRGGDLKPGLLGKRKPKQESRQIDIGWLHWDENDQKFKLVRKPHGGGTRSLTVNRTSTADTVQKIAEGLFFKGGESTKGKLEDQETSLVDVAHQHILSSRTVDEMYKETKMRVLRFYLQTRDKTAERGTDISSHSESELETSTAALNESSVASSSFQDTDTPTIKFHRRHQTCEEPACTASTSAYDKYVDLISSSDDNDEEDFALAAAIEQSLTESQPVSRSGSQKTVQEVISSLEQSVTGEAVQIIVNRRKMWKSVMYAIQDQGFTFARPIDVSFAGEEAEDGGGPTREFFKLLMRELARQDIFDGYGGNLTFRYNIAHIQKGTYRTAAQLVQWSLSHGGPGLNGLNPSVFQAMVGKSHVSLSEVDNISDAAFRENVQKIQGCSSEQFQATVEDLTDWLIDQGVNNVRNVQRTELVQGLLDHYFVYRVQPALNQFICGLGDDLWQDIQQNPDSTRFLLVKHDTPLNPKDMKDLYEVDTSPQGSNLREREDDTLYCFEIFLQHCSGQNVSRGHVTLSQLLDFWTGADCIPPGGFRKQLRVSFYTPVTGIKRLPSAHTCGPVLWLPRGIDDPDYFSQLMDEAVNGCQGFGLI